MSNVNTIPTGARARAARRHVRGQEARHAVGVRLLADGAGEARGDGERRAGQGADGAAQSDRGLRVRHRVCDAARARRDHRRPGRHAHAGAAHSRAHFG